MFLFPTLFFPVVVRVRIAVSFEMHTYCKFMVGAGGALTYSREELMSSFLTFDFHILSPSLFCFSAQSLDFITLHTIGVFFFYFMLFLLLFSFQRKSRALLHSFADRKMNFRIPF